MRANSLPSRKRAKARPLDPTVAAWFRRLAADLNGDPGLRRALLAATRGPKEVKV